MTWRPGNGRIPSTRRSIHIPGRSRSPDDPSPQRDFRPSFSDACASGRAPPSLQPQASENFLTLIVGRSHLDCRAAGTPFQTFQAGNLLTLLANHLGQRGNLTEQINQQSFKLWPGQAGKGNRRRWHMMQRSTAPNWRKEKMRSSLFGVGSNNRPLPQPGAPPT